MIGRVAVLLCCTVLAVACGPSTTTTSDAVPATTVGDTSPPAASPTTTATDSAPSTTNAPAPTTAATTGPEPAAARPPLGSTLPVGFLLVDGEGLWSVAEDGTFELLATGAVHSAFDDRAGGIVLQGDPWVYGEGAPPPIYHLRAGATEVERIVTPGEQEIVAMESVVVVDGAPTLLYLSRTWFNNPSTASEVLVALDLETGTKQPIASTGGWESGATRVSYGGDVYAIEGSGEGFSWLSFIDGFGFPIDYPTNPIPDATECFDTFECPTGSVISPDGLNLVFARQGSDGSAALVQFFLGSGAESSDEVAEFPFWIDYDGTVVAAYLAPLWSDVVRETAVYELTDGGLVEHGRLPGWASIARSDIEIPEPVVVPGG